MLVWERRPLWDASALAPLAHPSEQKENPRHPRPAPALFVGSLGGGDLSPPAPYAWWLRNSSPRSLRLSVARPRLPTGKQTQKRAEKKIRSQIGPLGKTAESAGRREEKGGRQGKRKRRKGEQSEPEGAGVPCPGWEWGWGERPGQPGLSLVENMRGTWGAGRAGAEDLALGTETGKEH